MPLLGKAVSHLILENCVVAEYSDIHSKLGVPFRILAATAKDEYRKPNIGMWNALQEAYNAQGITLGTIQSVGMSLYYI